MVWFRFWVGVFILLAMRLPAQAQSSLLPAPQETPDTTRKVAAKLPVLAAGVFAGYAGGLVLLNEAWYKNTPRSSFHWFNDARQWKQVDKAGHFWSAFHISRLGVDVLKGAGISEKKAIWYGGALGFALLTPIEYLDGHSPDYGASLSDIGANATGSLFVIGQHLAWNELRVQPKFSFHRTRFAPLRPNVLGNGLGEEMLKDYNGHTYWLSVDVAKFLPASSRYPTWLNLALGYGAEEMVDNDAHANRAIGLNSYRQYYLSLDLNWKAIPTRSKFLRSTFYVLSIFKFPAPALEYNARKGWRMHAIYL